MQSVVSKIFLFVVLLKNLVESYLTHRNRLSMQRNRHQVPDKFTGQISLEEHQKAADYGQAKSKASQFFQFYDLIVLLLWTLGGGLQFLNDQLSLYTFSPLAKGVLFFGFFLLINMLIGLPQSLYSTFVLEEKFGFNKTTPKLFVIDMIKGLCLGALIGGPILYAVLWIMTNTENWWLYAWLTLTGFQFVLIWAYPRFIAPLFNKFSPLDEGETKEKVLGLLNRTGFTSNGLFVMNASIRSSHGNAYFTGFGKNKRIVFFDTLIKILSPTEVEAVLAHELGHFKRKHIVKGLVRSLCLSLIGFYALSVLSDWEPFFTGHGVQSMEAHMTLVLFILVSSQYTFFLTPLSAWISRKYEFEADQFAAENANARDLIGALVKLYKDNASTLTPDSLYSSFYHSHPPALVRVHFLEKLSQKKAT